MHKPESFLENESHKVLWEFEIQIDPLISARRRDLMDFAISVDHRKKAKREIDIARELKPI